ncbi:Kelch repeat-containing protein [Actinocrinis puniceicyclus]|uniref:Kelch repeat-containing protein n=1 Tax=Actinocrinis puniceicyclus TaxID=977794 RepID=UPI001B8DA584|nr:kelch repeat-containing protein [Actinocrinis puniceicyclus]
MRLAAVLAAGSLTTAVFPPTAHAAASGTWSDTGSLATAREFHTASLLGNGEVLVAGGYNSSAVLTSAELYNPATGTWSRTGSLSTPRYAATSTTLADGRVLVAGGRNGYAGGEQTSTELYNPATGKWSPGASMAYPRAEDLAVRLGDGRVLVAGQRNVAVQGDATPTAEVYDPKQNRWTTTGPTGVSSGCCNPRGVLLPDGRVLTTLGTSSLWTAGGGGPTIFNPATQSWSRLPAAPVFLGDGPQISLLPSGNVLFAGGWESDGWSSTWPTNVVEELNPVTGTWTVRQSTNFTSFYTGQSLTTLADGRALASGGASATDNDEVYDPTTATWSIVGGQNRADATVTLLADGRVLTAGGIAYGSDSGVLGTAQIFQP